MDILMLGDNIKNGNYALHSAFDKVQNYISADTLLSIVTNNIGFGPNFITTSSNEFKKITNITVKDNSIYFNGIKISKENHKLYSSKLNLTGLTLSFFKNIASIPQKYSHLFANDSLFYIVSKKTPHFTNLFDKTLHRFIMQNIKIETIDDFPTIVKKMKGLGKGLTPSGDDFNIGIIYALNLLNCFITTDLSPIINLCYKNALGKNPISNSFLYYAYKNLYYSDFKEFLLNPSEQNLKNVISHGHTSGSDMLSGFIFTISYGLKNIIKKENL